MNGEEQPLAAYVLGLLDSEEHDSVARAIATTPRLRRRVEAWSNAAAAITVGTLIIEQTQADARLEQRLIQRAREARQPKSRARYSLRRARRGVAGLALVSLIAAAVLFAVLAFQPDDPISGHAVGLSDDGAVGVLLPQYKDQLFALNFWGLPELDPSQTWQLWLVRQSGAVEPGPQFAADAEGRAAVSIHPDDLESEDALIGFAVSADDPARRADGTPSSQDIRYQFSRP